MQRNALYRAILYVRSDGVAYNTANLVAIVIFSIDELRRGGDCSAIDVAVLDGGVTVLRTFVSHEGSGIVCALDVDILQRQILDDGV